MLHVCSGKGGVETLQHSHDVLALAYRPDGKLLASATLDGQIYLWDPQEAQLLVCVCAVHDTSHLMRVTLCAITYAAMHAVSYVIVQVQAACHQLRKQVAHKPNKLLHKPGT